MSNVWSGYTRQTAAVNHRSIVLSFGEIDTGKTRLGLTAPGPILVQSLDEGMEGVVEKILGNPADPAYDPKKEIYTKSYDWDPSQDSFSQDYAVKLRDEIKKDFYFGLQHARTIIWDKETDIWQVFRYAEFGGPSEAPKNYARLNQEYFKLINAAKSTSVNLFLIESMKDEWGNTKGVNSQTGATVNKPVQTGRRVRQGFDRLGEIVLMEIYHTYEDGKFYFEIGKCKQNEQLKGEKIEAVTFPELGQLLHPDSKEADWL